MNDRDEQEEAPYQPASEESGQADQPPSHPGDKGPEERLTPREAIERGRSLLSEMGGEQFSDPERQSSQSTSAEEIGIETQAETSDWEEWLFAGFQKVERLNRRLEEAGLAYRVRIESVSVEPGEVELELNVSRV